MQNQNPTNPGASDAKDFQPQTGNPQAATGQLAPASGGLQQPGSSQLLESTNLNISVPSNPAPASNAVAEVRGGPELLFISLLLAAVGLALFQYWRQQRKVLAGLSEEVDSTPAAVLAPAPKPKKKNKKQSRKQRAAANSRR